MSIKQNKTVNTFDSDKALSLLKFINETKNGKFSKEKPFVENIHFSRIEIDKRSQDIQEIPENLEITNILFGISN